MKERTTGRCRLLLRLLCLATASFFVIAGPLRAQVNSEPVVIGQKIRIHSRILDEERILLIKTPAGYNEGAERYPVLYLLDGEENFVQTAGIVDFLETSDRIPPLLVVAIANTKRTRDLTPHTQDEMEIRFHPENGGADSFLAFIRTELVPFIDQHYRTRPYKVLVGHSLGGLFSLYVMASTPQVFSGYIVIDPPLSWNHDLVLSKIGAAFQGTRELSSDLYLTATNESDVTHRLCEILHDKAPKGFRWTFKPMSEETHVSLVHQSIYSGLDTIFDGWHLSNRLRLYDSGGLAAVDRHFSEGGKRYGYQRQASPFTVSLIVADLLEKGRLEDAGALLLQDPKRFPPPWNQLEALARAYTKQGNKQEAIRYYKLSLQQNPKNEWARRALEGMEADVNSQTQARPH
jgi:hypothetical protein